MPLGKKSNSLAAVLDELTTEAAPELTEHLEHDDLRCYACGHRCLIKEGKRGICKVRFNERGRLLVPTNYVAARLISSGESLKSGIRSVTISDQKPRS